MVRRKNGPDVEGVGRGRLDGVGGHGRKVSLEEEAERPWVRGTNGRPHGRGENALAKESRSGGADGGEGTGVADEADEAGHARRTRAGWTRINFGES